MGCKPVQVVSMCPGATSSPTVHKMAQDDMVSYVHLGAISPISYSHIGLREPIIHSQLHLSALEAGASIMLTHCLHICAILGRGLVLINTEHRL